MSAHSEKLLDHFQNPRNPGVLEAPGVSVEVENPACGDLMKLAVRVEDHCVAEVRYQVRGCTASIAAGSALTEWMAGRPLSELRAAQASQVRQSVEQALGGLQPASKHAATLCSDALQHLLKRIPAD